MSVDCHRMYSVAAPVHSEQTKEQAQAYLSNDRKQRVGSKSRSFICFCVNNETFCTRKWFVHMIRRRRRWNADSRKKARSSQGVALHDVKGSTRATRKNTSR